MLKTGRACPHLADTAVQDKTVVKRVIKLTIHDISLCFCTLDND